MLGVVGFMPERTSTKLHCSDRYAGMVCYPDFVVLVILFSTRQYQKLDVRSNPIIIIASLRY